MAAAIRSRSNPRAPTVDELSRALEEIRAIRDCESVRRLCLDCWAYAQQHGEPAGLCLAGSLKSGVIEYQRRGEWIKTAIPGGPRTYGSQQRN